MEHYPMVLTLSSVNNMERKEVNLDVHCTDDIPCHSPVVIITGIIIFILVLFLV